MSMAAEVHPTASIAPGAELGLGVSVGPYTVIGPRVKVGDGTEVASQVVLEGDITIGSNNRIGPQVVIRGRTTLGSDNTIVGQANLGGTPQDLTYRGEDTLLVVGDRNTIREFVTINLGTVKGGGMTRIGSDCLLMACSHVAHDCILEDRVILANTVLLGGHVRVETGANLGGACAVHHFVSIGAYSYAGGMSRISQDVPPFMLLEGHPARVRNVNWIGLERAGFTKEDIESLHEAHKLIYRSGNLRRSTLQLLKESPNANPLIMDLVQALENTDRGVKGRYRESLREEFQRDGLELILGEPRPA